LNATKNWMLFLRTLSKTWCSFLFNSTTGKSSYLVSALVTIFAQDVSIITVVDVLRF